jgi:hypothetical protein
MNSLGTSNFLIGFLMNRVTTVTQQVNDAAHEAIQAAEHAISQHRGVRHA